MAAVLRARRARPRSLQWPRASILHGDKASRIELWGSGGNVPRTRAAELQEKKVKVSLGCETSLNGVGGLEWGAPGGTTPAAQIRIILAREVLHAGIHLLLWRKGRKVPPASQTQAWLAAREKPPPLQLLFF